MSTHGETPRWRPADEWLKSIEDTPNASHRSSARPVTPASDTECYALNPPLSLRGLIPREARRRRRTAQSAGTQLSRQEAEQAAREVAARRIDTTSDARLAQDDT